MSDRADKLLRELVASLSAHGSNQYIAAARAARAYLNEKPHEPPPHLAESAMTLLGPNALQPASPPHAAAEPPYPNCIRHLSEQGKPYPRTCAECGLGPCKRDYPHRYAAAEPVGQPVAWMYEKEVGRRVFHSYRLLDHDAGWTETPLYASPSAQPIAREPK